MRLLKPDELPADWDPTTDTRLTAWEMVHHLIRVLEAGGEGAAAELVAKLGSQGRDRPRTLLPPLHPVRAQEARGTRRWPTTAWCRAGRRSPGWRAKRRAPIKPGTDDLFDQE